MKFLPLVWAGLWRKRTRTFFTLLSILIAFLLFGMLQGTNAAFSRGVDAANVNRLVTVSRISFTEPLPYADLAQIEALPGVDHVAFASWFGAYYQDPKQFIFSFPVDPERYFNLYPEFKLPKEQLDTWKRTRTGVVIGIGLAHKYGWKIGDRVPLHSTIWTKPDGTSDWDFDVVGIYEDPQDAGQENAFFINHAYFDEARAFGKGTIGWYIVRIKDPTTAVATGEAIDKLFLNSQDETKTQTEKEFQQSFIKQMGDINFIVTAILGAVFFTLLFLTGNTMMQSLRERVPELAVLKTLGFTDGGVLMLVLAECLVLCVIAAALGLAAAAALFPMLKDVVGIVNLPLEVVGLGIGVAVLLALVTGLPPAWRAMRLNIVDALAGR
ncbi:MAG TPA: FtsX-like permease family protein [Aliidongia sp.]|uniref:ABC transporter permease n=1 Tax=Aliidongia sp. TaxID=1914230 RepID=UPI002DDD6C85|nr:FtsX-like permease family protein [Aliidongia sp.]HEV2676295.1 FtsX-like permease family protein [Aliidongia sp.]